MTKNTQTMEIQHQDNIADDEMERTRSRRCFVPKSDIYETDKEIIVLADIPGADEKRVEINLEKNILSINATSDPVPTSGYDMTYAEYEEGDFQRSFRLSDEIDREKIEANFNDGVLRLSLPKVQGATTKKITVKSN